MNNGDKFLSITTRTSLSDQREKSSTELNMRNYQDIRADLQSPESLSICLNSLAKLGELDETELNTHTVYIDEVSSFIEFTHNDTLDAILKDVFVLLCRLVKHADKAEHAETTAYAKSSAEESEVAEAAANTEPAPNTEEDKWEAAGREFKNCSNRLYAHIKNNGTRQTHF